MTWTAAPWGLACGPLHVSFQRFARPASGRVAAVPRSLGALAVARCGDGFLLPVGDGEAFWIGLSVAAGEAPVTVRITAGRHDGIVLRSGGLAVPPVRSFAGFPDEAGWSVLDTAVAALTLECGAAARVELVGWASFSRRTGADPPGPLDPSAAYGLWRLP